MRSDLKKKKQKKTDKQTSGGAVCTSLFLPHHQKFVFTKKCLLYTSRSQTCKLQLLSRNKYTRSQKKWSGGQTAFDKRDTDTLIEDIQKHSTVWWFSFVTSNTDVQTLLAEGHFFKRSIRNQSRCWLTEIFPGGAYFPSLDTKKGVWVEVCVPLKDSSSRCPAAASIQHSLPEKIQKLKGIQKLYSERSNRAVGSTQHMQVQKQTKTKKLQLWHPFTIFLFLCVWVCRRST